MINNIISLKQKKEERELSRGRRPLHISYLNGKVTGSPHFNQPDVADFNKRMRKIQKSLERVRELMDHLNETERSNND